MKHCQAWSEKGDVRQILSPLLYGALISVRAEGDSLHMEILRGNCFRSKWEKCRWSPMYRWLWEREGKNTGVRQTPVHLE